MNNFLYAMTAGALMLFPGSPAWAQDEQAPAGTRVEAESQEAQEFAEIIEDADASGGKAVRSHEAWRPIFRHAISSDTPDRVTIHVRRLGGPIILKARVDGENKDLKADYSKPKTYTWVNMGTFTRDQLGDRIEVIRGKADTPPRLDCVVISPVAADTDTPQNAGDAGIQGDAAALGGALPPYQPRAELEVQDIALKIDWDADRGTLGPRHWGLALYHPVQGKADQDAGFIDYLVQVKPGLVRIHRAGLGQAWMNQAKTAFDDGLPVWDQEIIARALAPVQALRDQGVKTDLMVCLSDWPTWFSKDKLVDPEQLEQARAIVRELVETAEATGVRVDAWEMLNEADNAYAKADRLDDLWVLFKVMTEAVRSADPSAQVGGPAFTWANPQWVVPFLDACGTKIDFISWHNYAGGHPTLPNATLFEQIETIAGHGAYVKEQLATRGLEDVKTYLTEVNVQWTWKPFERRHANNVGAAFQAMMITRMAMQDVTGVAIWHAKGNAYGLIDSDDRLRATGQLYLLGQHLQGVMGAATVHPAAASTEHPDQAVQVHVVPVTRGDGTRALMLVNFGEPGVRVAVPESLRLQHRIAIDAQGLDVAAVDGGRVSLPGWSVTLLLETDPGLPVGRSELPGQHVMFDW